jgi:phage gp36-like protein
MPYATQAQLVIAAGGLEAFNQLFDSFEGSTAADVIAQSQAAADGWIDGFLRMRFATPIASPPLTIQILAAEESVYCARKWRSRAAITEDQHKDHEAREATLKAIASGSIRPDEPAPAQSTAVRAEFVTNSGAVSREKLEGLL